MTANAQQQQRLTLAEAEALARRNHPAVTTARFTAEAAAELPTQLDAARFPTIYGSVTGAASPGNTRIAAGVLNNPIIFSRLAAGVTVSQLLFDSGRTRHAVASAEARAQAEEQNHQAVEQAVLLEVDRAYFDVLRARAVMQVAEQTVQARQLVVDQVTELERARLKSGLDLSFAQVALEEARLLRVSAQNQLAAAEASLSDSLGLSTTQKFELVDGEFRVEPLQLPELEQRALGNRPDLKARTLDVDAAREQSAAEKALSRPQVSATASAGVIPVGASALRAGFAAGGVNINLPFLNGGLYKSRQAEAELRERAARDRATVLENRILRDVRIALLNVNTAAERTRLTEQLMIQAGHALDLAQSRYELGLSSIVEFNQAQLARTSAEIQNANAKYDYQLQRAVLQYQVGR